MRSEWKDQHRKDFSKQIALSQHEEDMLRHEVVKGHVMSGELRWAGSDNGPCFLVFIILCNPFPLSVGWT